MDSIDFPAAPRPVLADDAKETEDEGKVAV
jgi:hypothetical protein